MTLTWPDTRTADGAAGRGRARGGSRRGAQGGVKGGAQDDASAAALGDARVDARGDAPTAAGPTPTATATATATESVADSVRGDIALIAAALDHLRATQWERLADAQILAAAAELESTLRSGFGTQIRLAGEVERRGIAGLHGERSAAHVLAHLLRIPVGQAKARLAAAAVGLDSLTLTGDLVPAPTPDLAAEIDSGTISDEHAAVITSCLAKLPAALDETTQTMCVDVLLGEARSRDPLALRRVADQLLQICDPDGTIDGRHPAERMELHFGLPRRDGLTPIRGLLDALTAEQLRVAVEELAAPQPVDEHTPDRRPAPLRRAQAFAEVLARYHTTIAALPDGPATPGPRARVVLTLNASQLASCGGDPGNSGHIGMFGSAGNAGNAGTVGRIGMFGSAGNAGHAGQFDYGTWADSTTARMLTCDSILMRQVLGADSEVLDQGRSVRLFTRSQRRALITRDRGCAFPGCDIPAGWCEAHHITPWSEGGATDLSNGILLCRRHHTIIHQGHWRIATSPLAGGATASGHGESRHAGRESTRADAVAPPADGPGGHSRGRPWFIPPAHVDPARKPRRNNYFHLPALRVTVART